MQRRWGNPPPLSLSDYCGVEEVVVGGHGVCNYSSVDTHLSFKGTEGRDVEPLSQRG